VLFDAIIVIIAAFVFYLNIRHYPRRFLFLNLLLIASRGIFIGSYIFIMKSQYEYYTRLVLSLAQSCFGFVIAVVITCTMIGSYYCPALCGKISDTGGPKMPFITVDDEKLPITRAQVEKLDEVDLIVETNVKNKSRQLEINISNKESRWKFSKTLNLVNLYDVIVAQIDITREEHGNKITVTRTTYGVPDPKGITETGEFLSGGNTKPFALQIRIGRTIRGEIYVTALFKHQGPPEFQTVATMNSRRKNPDITTKFMKKDDMIYVTASIGRHNNFSPVIFQLKDNPTGIVQSRPKTLAYFPSKQNRFARLNQRMELGSSRSMAVKWRHH
jgi:hypothetical protein